MTITLKAWRASLRLLGENMVVGILQPWRCCEALKLSVKRNCYHRSADLKISLSTKALVFPYASPNQKSIFSGANKLTFQVGEAKSSAAGVGRLSAPGRLSFCCAPQSPLDRRSKTARQAMTATSMAAALLKYPEVRRDEEVVDDYHGTKIADPYRWLEDPDSEETKQFVEKQNEVTESVLKECDTREKFKTRMTELYDYPKIGCPFKRGGRYFFYKNTGLQAQYVLYVQDSLDAEPEVFLDPNKLSEDGTVALGVTAFSKDGRYFAYGLSASGSDWETIHVLRVHDKVEEPDILKWVKFSSIAWTHDGLGFFYGRYPEPANGEEVDAGTETDLNLNQRLCYHVLGTPQSEDVVVWEDPEHPKRSFSPQVTKDGRYLIITSGETCDPVNSFFYYDLQSLPGGGFKGYSQEQGALPVVKLIDNFDALYEYIANDGTSFTLRTNKDAPMNKLVRVDLNAPGTWTDVVKESSEDVLEWAVRANTTSLLVCYLHDVKSVLQLHDLETGAFVRALPLDIGSITSATALWDDPEIFYSFSSFLTPTTIFRIDLSAPHDTPPAVFLETEVKGFDRSLFETRQVFVTSKDGTKIPMFIVARAGLVLDGSHPALLYGYGGFNISITPSFSLARIILIQNFGAITAIANIRGGGEYGERWHKAGSLAEKQNCFDDFISCGEYLVKEGYTKASKLAIEGGSNGGLLVAACTNQRPDLFACSLAHVGVMDMLRFHKFTIGHAWTSDYGCADKPEEFDSLIKYSPLHNVRRPWDTVPGNQYPSIMILTADHDDRVVPLHSLKLLATLQYECCGERHGEQQRNPIIARIDTKAGHGAGRPTKKVIEEASDKYSFMAKMVGATWHDASAHAKL